MTTPRHQAPISLRLRFHDDARIGPGKIALLEAIRAKGSVAQAAETMNMSARRAWLLIESLNNAFDQPLVDHQQPVTNHEKEAQLTTLGTTLVDTYRDIETRTLESVQQRMSGVISHLKQPPD